MDREVQREIHARMKLMDTTIEDLEDTLVLLRQTIPSPSQSQPHSSFLDQASSHPSGATEGNINGAQGESSGGDKDKQDVGTGSSKRKGKEKKSRHLSLKGPSKKSKTKRSASQPDLLTFTSLTSPTQPSASFPSTPRTMAPTKKPSTNSTSACTTASSSSRVGGTRTKCRSLNRGSSDQGPTSPGHPFPRYVLGGTSESQTTHSQVSSASNLIPGPSTGSIVKGEKGRVVVLDTALEPDGMITAHSEEKDKEKKKRERGMSKSGSHLLGSLFHRRPSSHKLKAPESGGLVPPPGDSPPLAFHQPSRVTSSTATTLVHSTTNSAERIPIDPQTLLDDLAKSIADLRHQHSSLLTLYPLSNGRSRPGSGSAGEQSAEEGEFHSVADGLGEQARRVGMRSRSRSTTGSDASGSETASSRAADTVSPSTDLEHGLYFGTTATQNGVVTDETVDPHATPRRRHTAHRHGHGHGHAHRSSLSSMYAEVASIYYDAEVVLDPEEADVLVASVDHVRALPSTVSEEDMERALKEYESKRVVQPTPPLSPTSAVTAQSYTAATVRGPIVRRTALAAPTPAHEPSLIGMLRKNVGKDLSTISFDVTFNEPISLLQKLAEEVEYVHLLKLAAVAVDPIERIAHVAAFAVSQYANGKHRTSRKPFNPLMGETFELIRPELGMRFIAEKVRHHPPKLACHAEGEGWAYWCTSSAKNKLAGMSLEVQPTGSQYVELTDKHERYTWTKPPSYMRNLVAGTRYVETIGDLLVTNETTGERCTITFKEGGWGGSGRNVVTGICYGADDTKAAWISGVWDSHLDVRYGGPKDPSHPLWLATPWPLKPERNYGFTRWAIELNEPIGGNELAEVALTDSRLRPDQRLLEQGCFIEADEVKKRLEDAQRARRAAGREHRSRWFRAADGGDAEDWVYEGKYFEERDARTLQQHGPMDLW